jgi:uncharacterized protein YjbI with pentapeptide repeats
LNHCALENALVEGVVIESSTEQPFQAFLQNVTFSNCFFAGEMFALGLIGCTFRNCAFRVSLLNGMTYGGSSTDGAIIDACEFRTCSIFDSSLVGASMSNTTFVRCAFTDSYMRHARCHNVTVRETVLHWVDCHGIYASQGLRFESCDLFNANFDSADLRGAAFRGSTLFCCQALGAQALCTDEADRVVELLR